MELSLPEIPIDQAASYLLDASWQSAILIGVGWLINLILLKSSSPRTQRSFWIALLLAIPFLPLASQWAMTNGFPTQPILTQSQDDTGTGRILPSPVLDAPLLSPSSYFDDIPKTSPNESTPFFKRLSLLLVAIALFLALSVLLAILRIRYWTYRARPVTDPILVHAFERAKSDLGIRAPCFLLEGGKIASPLSVGIWNYRVMLPVGMASTFSEPELESLARHELAHIRQLDPLLFAYSALLRSLLFLNPLVWWTTKRIRLLSEVCADANAVGAEGKVRPYTELLIRVAEELPARQPLALVANAVSGKSEFVRRVEWLATGARHRRSTRRAIPAFLTLIACLIALLPALAFPLFPFEPSLLAVDDRAIRHQPPMEAIRQVRTRLGWDLPIRINETGTWNGRDVSESTTFLSLVDSSGKVHELFLDRDPRKKSFGQFFLGGTYPVAGEVSLVASESEDERAIRMALLSWIDQRYSRKDWETLVRQSYWPGERSDWLHALVIDEVLDSSLRFQDRL